MSEQAKPNQTTTSILTEERKQQLRNAQQTYYKKNKFKIQQRKKRLLLKKGVQLRPQTIIKFGLEKEAEKKGLDTKLNKANVVPQLFEGDGRAVKQIKEMIEKRLKEYDQQIREMISLKQKEFELASRGQTLIPEGTKLTFNDLKRIIPLVPAYNPKTVKDYIRTLDKMVNKMDFPCDADQDVMECFNNFEGAIEKIESAKNKSGGKSYSTNTLITFFSIPMTLSTHIPEFKMRLTPVALNAFTKKYNYYVQRRNLEQMKKLKGKGIRWEDVIKMREVAGKKEPYSLTHTILSLYTYLEPLRNDFGFVKIIKTTPRDKKDNYYNPKTGKFYLNKFKTAKMYKGEPPYIFGPELKKIVNKYIEKAKSKTFIFEKKNGKPYAGYGEETTAYSFNSIVNTALNKYNPNKKIRITTRVVRRSRASNIQSENFDFRFKVARLMRHKVSTQAGVYTREKMEEMFINDDDGVDEE